MTERIDIRPASESDVSDLMSNLRTEDADEIAMSGSFADPAQAIAASVATSSIVMAARMRGELLCLFGARRMPSGSALLWELGTYRIRRHPRAFLRASIDGLHAAMNALPDVDDFYNYLPDAYATYRAWLERYLGAVFAPDAHPSVTGTAFREFHIRRRKET